MADLQNTTINTTGYLKMPVGTVAQRPSGLTASDAGMIRLCTNFPGYSTPVVEYYDGTDWKSLYTPGVVGSGGTLTTVGGDNIHSFTSDGNSTFSVITE